MHESPNSQPPSGPLAGIRVLDFTERMQGPYGTQILSDFGADVIKVERPQSLTSDGRPDERYGSRFLYGKAPEDSRFYTAGFLAANRNKRSIALNLKSEQGVAVARKLVEFCSVVYENFRPGVMKRLGLGYEDCKAINPAIIYASASGYGQSGPYVDLPGQDILAQAVGGFGAMNADDLGRPVPVGMSITDVLGGMNGAMGVLAALVHRAQTGEGQRVEVSLLESAIACQSEQAVHYLNTAVGEMRRRTPGHGMGYIPSPYGFYATRDGYIALSSGRQIQQYCRILGLPDLTKDARFNEYWAREENREEFEGMLESALQAKTTKEWVELMRAEDLFCAPVNTFEQTFSDPQVHHTEMVVEVESPIGPLRLIGVPFKLSKTPATVRTAPPLHSQHSFEILEMAGYGEEEIADLIESGAVTPPILPPQEPPATKNGASLGP
jgi:crotonobetainyl-CoA:carnitine CoA-transferase CaiB-like acyl-CoA transferase